MADPITISAIIVSIITAIGVFFSKIHLRHCKACFCCDSDCIDDNNNDNQNHQQSQQVKNTII